MSKSLLLMWIEQSKMRFIGGVPPGEVGVD